MKILICLILLSHSVMSANECLVRTSNTNSHQCSRLGCWTVENINYEVYTLEEADCDQVLCYDEVFCTEGSDKEELLRSCDCQNATHDDLGDYYDGM